MNKRKDAYIIIRVEKEEKKRLVDLAGGVRRLSEYLRNVFAKKI